MTVMPTDFRCLLVEKWPDGSFARNVSRRATADLPPGDVLIHVEYSSLNFKDALSATGAPGVSKTFPHVPGIDAAGVIVESTSDSWSVGQEVLVTGYDLGTSHWGGWAEFVRVPAEWVVAQPRGLSARDSMALGTAGFTAALCVDALLRHDVQPDRGEVVVTGASGGVGSLAVALLAQLGFSVVAVTGKPAAEALLLKLGAKRVAPRDEVHDASRRPLLAARWSGAVDTVGGDTLATLLRSTSPLGCVAACGLVGGADLPLSVYPFILRGVSLIGIDSAFCPMDKRRELWSRLASQWRLTLFDDLVTEIGLDALDRHLQEILAGRQIGRVVVRTQSSV